MSLTLTDQKIVVQAMLILQKDCKYHQSHTILANQFLISESKLRKIFKEFTGKSINEYLTETRIEKAKEFLCNTDDPIKMIAHQVGYDTRNLGKQFKNITGMKPLQWRNKYRKTKLSIK
jgi:two-component system response regulator YesN